jgi:small-conductance mechanosensitive channel
MLRQFACVLVSLALAVGAPARAGAADAAIPPAASATQAAATPTPVPAITPAQAQQVLDVLNDPTKRAAFAATLQAIVTGLPAPSSATNPPAAAKPAAAATVAGLPIKLAPNSLGAQVLVGATSFLNHTASQALGAFTEARNLPALGHWLASLLTDPTDRARLLDAAWRLALAVGCGLIVQWAIRRALRGPVAALEAPLPEPPIPALPEPLTPARSDPPMSELPVPPSPQRTRRHAGAWALTLRLPVVLARLALGLVPVLGFIIIGHLVAGSAMGGDPSAQLVLLAVIDAYAVCAAILGTAHLILLPPQPRLRLFPVPDAVAAYAMRWLRLMVVVTVAGYAAAEVGLVFGLSDTGHEDLLNLVILFDHACLAVIVLQQRQPVRDWIRAPAGATGTLAGLRDALAATWHWLALTVLLALWVVRAAEVPGGYSRMIYLFGVTVAVLLLAWTLRVRAVFTLDRALHLRAPAASRYPGLDTRLHRYQPVLHAVAEAVVYVAAAVMLLQLWGIDAFDWLFSSRLGQQLVSTVITVLVTLLLALLVWEAAESGTERHLARLANEGLTARAARVRTLLPMLRTTLLIIILLVVGLMMLSAIGVNTAPLLAGAGIVGLAVGFGSQKLVQDVITGIFLLLENAMQIGDWVTVSGLSGTVENLSVRMIRLRAGDGSVHVIPFSSVTSVTNTNRGIGNASVSVSVAFAEDTDRVCDVLKDIAAQMREEPNFAAVMLSDLQLWGVDKVDGSAVTIDGQIVCTDSGRWGVQREFNRRMKKRFQEQDIEIFNPLRMFVMEGNTARSAPEGDQKPDPPARDGRPAGA